MSFDAAYWKYLTAEVIGETCSSSVFRPYFDRQEVPNSFQKPDFIEMYPSADGWSRKPPRSICPRCKRSFLCGAHDEANCSKEPVNGRFY